MNGLRILLVTIVMAATSFSVSAEEEIDLHEFLSLQLKSYIAYTPRYRRLFGIGGTNLNIIDEYMSVMENKWDGQSPHHLVPQSDGKDYSVNISVEAKGECLLELRADRIGTPKTWDGRLMSYTVMTDIVELDLRVFSSDLTTMKVIATQKGKLYKFTIGPGIAARRRKGIFDFARRQSGRGGAVHSKHTYIRASGERGHSSPPYSPFNTTILQDGLIVIAMDDTKEFVVKMIKELFRRCGRN